MKLNPFENLKNEYELKDVLIKDWWGHKVKEEYENLLGRCFDYETLVKCINTKIDWHILTTGSYQGDYWYFAQYNNKIYFVNIGYGSCSGCDAFQASQHDINDLIELQDNIKRDIREFDNLEELISWILNSNEWWLSEKDEILDFIKKEFNIDFEIEKVVKIKKKGG